MKTRADHEAMIESLELTIAKISYSLIEANRLLGERDAVLKLQDKSDGLDRIYTDFVESNHPLAMETMLLAFVRLYGSLSIEQLADFTGQDVHQTRTMVKNLRAKKLLADEGLVTI